MSNEAVLLADGQSALMSQLVSSNPATSTIGQLTVTQWERAGSGAPLGGNVGVTNVGRTFVGSATTAPGIAVEQTQTSGVESGFKPCVTATQTSAGGSSGSMAPCFAAVLGHGGTGAMPTATAPVLVSYGTDPHADPAAAIGAIAQMAGIDVQPFVLSGVSSSGGSFASVRVRRPLANGTHVISAQTGVQVDNQASAAGVTTAIGVDIAAQTGGSSVNLGIRNAGDLLQLGRSGFYGVNPVAQQTVTGALSTVADAPAKAVLTSIISALATMGLISNGTT